MGASNQSNQEVQGSVQSSLGATTRQYFLSRKKKKAESRLLKNQCCQLREHEQL